MADIRYIESWSLAQPGAGRHPLQVPSLLQPVLWTGFFICYHAQMRFTTFRSLPYVRQSPRRLECVIGFLLCLGLAAQADADTPQPWGIRVFAEESERPPVPQSLSSEALIQLDLAAEKIANIERGQGPYSPDLTGPLLETAQIAAEYGEIDRAMELYRWGLYTLRVNQGLNASEQLPVIEQMLGILRASGDLEAYQNRSDYLYRLMGRGAKPWTDDRLIAAERWLQARTELLVADRLEGRESELLFLLEHAEELREEVCADQIWASRFCAQLTLRLLALLYVLDYHVDPLVVDSYGSVQRSSYGNTLGYNNDFNQTPLEQRLRSLEQGVRSRGRRILNDALEITPENSALTRALADWSWFHGRTGEALSLYGALINEDDDVRSGGALSDPRQPMPIPAALFEPRDTALISREIEHYYITAVVNKRGLLKDIDIEPVDPNRTSLMSRGVRHLKSLRFSPALDQEGEPEDGTIRLRIAIIE